MAQLVGKMRAGRRGRRRVRGDRNRRRRREAEARPGHGVEPTGVLPRDDLPGQAVGSRAARAVEEGLVLPQAPLGAGAVAGGRVACRLAFFEPGAGVARKLPPGQANLTQWRAAPAGFKRKALVISFL